MADYKEFFFPSWFFFIMPEIFYQASKGFYLRDAFSLSDFSFWSFAFFFPGVIS